MGFISSISHLKWVKGCARTTRFAASLWNRLIKRWCWGKEDGKRLIRQTVESFLQGTSELDRCADLQKRRVGGLFSEAWMGAGFGRGGRRSLRVGLSFWDDTIHGNSPWRREGWGEQVSATDTESGAGSYSDWQKRGREGWLQSSRWKGILKILERCQLCLLFCQRTVAA